MKIGFGAQKGGVGKTTLSLIFSQWLLDRGQVPVCIDLDPQASLYGRWITAKQLLTGEPPFDVEKIDFPEIKDILPQLLQIDNPVVFDLPGNLEHDGMMEVLESLDLLICPFVYDPISFESTLVYAHVLKSIKLTTSICFVPNMVKSNVKYELKERASKALLEFGNIAPEISDWISMQRIELFGVSTRITENTLPTFQYISETYNIC